MSKVAAYTVCLQQFSRGYSIRNLEEGGTWISRTLLVNSVPLLTHFLIFSSLSLHLSTVGTIIRPAHGQAWEDFHDLSQFWVSTGMAWCRLSLRMQTPSFHYSDGIKTCPPDGIKTYPPDGIEAHVGRGHGWEELRVRGRMGQHHNETVTIGWNIIEIAFLDWTNKEILLITWDSRK